MDIREAIKNKRLSEIERTTLTVKEIAVYLDLSVDFIYKLAREKEIPHIRIGARIMFKKDSIDNWLSELEKDSYQV
jgi:excisionase family DNA binding protein